MPVTPFLGVWAVFRMIQEPNRLPAVVECALEAMLFLANTFLQITLATQFTFLCNPQPERLVLSEVELQDLTSETMRAYSGLRLLAA